MSHMLHLYTMAARAVVEYAYTVWQWLSRLTAMQNDSRTTIHLEASHASNIQ